MQSLALNISGEFVTLILIILVISVIAFFIQRKFTLVKSLPTLIAIFLLLLYGLGKYHPLIKAYNIDNQIVFLSIIVIFLYSLLKFESETNKVEERYINFVESLSGKININPDLVENFKRFFRNLPEVKIFSLLEINQDNDKKWNKIKIKKLMENSQKSGSHFYIDCSTRDKLDEDYFNTLLEVLKEKKHAMCKINIKKCSTKLNKEKGESYKDIRVGLILKKFEKTDFTSTFEINFYRTVLENSMVDYLVFDDNCFITLFTGQYIYNSSDIGLRMYIKSRLLAKYMSKRHDSVNRYNVTISQ